MVNVIDRFEGVHRWLSNFYEQPVVFPTLYKGETQLWIYKSAEAAYQAAKCVRDEDKLAILEAETPNQAKKLGRKVQIRSDWDSVKIDIMREVLRSKFEGTDYLAARLLATGDAHLEEGNWWGDKFWGTVNGAGRNWLGRLLMEERDRLRELGYDE